MNTFKQGQKWKQRGGGVAFITSADEGRVAANYTCPIRGAVQSIFTFEGRYWFHNQESEFDLIELVPDEPPVPGVRDAMYPDYVTPQQAAAAGIECGDTGCGGCNAGEAWCMHAKPARAALPTDAIECLRDVISHHGDFHMACTVTRDLHLRSNDRDSASYWDKQLRVLARMKVQAERVLAGTQQPAPASDGIHPTAQELEDAAARISQRLGIQIVNDPTLPPDTIRMVSGSSSVTVTNVGPCKEPRCAAPDVHCNGACHGIHPDGSPKDSQA